MLQKPPDQQVQKSEIEPKPKTVIIKKPCCKPIVWLGLGVAISMFLFGAWVLYQNYSKPAEETVVLPTPEPIVVNETANWNTYTNSVHGYSLKYPPQAELVDLDGVNIPEESRFLKIFSSDDIYATVMVTSVFRKNETLRAYVERTLINIDPKRSEINEFFIDNHHALTVSNTAAVNNKIFLQYLTYIEKDDDVIIQVQPEDMVKGENEHIKKVYDQILSTFKFLE